MGWQVVSDAPPGELYRSFLDSSQYSSASISRYERIFGSGFVSTGGAATTQVRRPPAAASYSPERLKYPPAEHRNPPVNLRVSV